MRVIEARGPNDAWPQALAMLVRDGTWEDTRNGRALVMPCPVATSYRTPRERLLLDPQRDQNPFFLLFESLWMLAGRDDGAYLDKFISTFSSRFGEPDGRIHGAYGRRWRDWFQRPGEPGDLTDTVDQLNECVRLLQEDPGTRQAVIQMWDPSADLGVPGLKDRPCNQSVMLRVRSEKSYLPGSIPYHSSYVEGHVLDITVVNRSNDVVWGLYSANAVQFSTLQEYLAARIGVGVGAYHHVSNNFHLYEATAKAANLESSQRAAKRRYPGWRALVDDPDSFDDELHDFMDNPDCEEAYRNTFFSDVARPMWRINGLRHTPGGTVRALEMCSAVRAPDWAVAAGEWLQRRI